jgi:membrane protein
VIELQRWWKVLRTAVREFTEDDALGLAQQVAFNSLLAFFPAAIFTVAVLGAVGAYDDLRSFLAPVVPSDALGVIDTIARDAGPSGFAAIALGAAGALWAASGAMATVSKAVNRARECETKRSFVRERLLGAVLVLALVGVVAVLLLVIVFGEPLGRALAGSAGLGTTFETTWDVVRWPLALLALLAFFSLVYNLGAVERSRWEWLTTGTVVGAGLWLALSGLLGLYASATGSYSRTYGTLASGIVLLVWLELSAVALLFGAELDSVLRAEGRGTETRFRPARTWYRRRVQEDRP